MIYSYRTLECSEKETKTVKAKEIYFKMELITEQYSNELKR